MIRSSDSLIALRPKLELPDYDTTTEVESFQNEALRPIIKFQHDLILKLFVHDKNFMKRWDQIKDKDDLVLQVSQYIAKQAIVQNRLIGMIIGLLSNDEFEEYLVHQKELNRRINNMIAQRVVSAL